MGRGGEVVQSVVFPNKICAEKELYFRTEGEVHFENERIYLLSNGKVTTDTYMNLFDAATWEKYTGIKEWEIRFLIKGYGKVYIKSEEHQIKELEIHSLEMLEEQMTFIYGEDVKASGQIYLEIKAIEEMELSDIQILAVNIDKETESINIAVNICTYHRQESLKNIFNEISHSYFFEEGSQLYGKLHVYIVDNASEIVRPKEELISVFHNPNTGGSGGFKRGLEEIRKECSKTKVTHVVFMDDDVELINETLYRLYAMLTLIKETYKNEVIAGRMFRLDNRKVQYTAAEIWNRGNIIHLGFNMDMTQRDILKAINDNTNVEYGGWWFCCFPMEFAKENDPLPFFLHCDDVEYGLRHGGTPIILNGIQVWHETYEYRQSPVMAYYDCRNSLIVNEMYCNNEINQRQIWDKFIASIDEARSKKDYLLEYYKICAFRDYQKGMRWFMKKDNAAIHKSLIKKKKAHGCINLIIRKIVLLKKGRCGYL